MPNVILPDFMIIGRTKCGTTTLARLLAEQPEVAFSDPKEPRFFSKDAHWERGLEWYSTVFPEAHEGKLVGEGSNAYTSPEFGVKAARRVAQTVPAVKLIYIVRHPEVRIRSHYRHRNWEPWKRENASLSQALQKPNNPYVAESMYHRCLLPFIESFPREQILVTRTEDLDNGTTWQQVIGFLGLPYRSQELTHENRSSEFSKSYISLPRFNSEFRRQKIRKHRTKVPQPVRMLAKQLLQIGGEKAYRRVLQESRTPIPDAILDPVWEDIARLEAWMGVDEPLWPRAINDTAV
jgi:hypothetical protein